MLREISIKIGDTYYNKYGEYVVINVINYNHITIKFKNTGFETETKGYCITNGKVKDYMFPIVCDIGFLGKKLEKVKHGKRVYNLWTSMLNRCYNEKNINNYRNHGAKGVTVDERWHNFSNFVEDIKLLENYNEWIKNDKSYSLDKDVRQVEKENKIYSFETCKFSTYQEQTDFSTSKEVIGYVDEIETLKFKSASEAGRILKLNRRSISYACAQKRIHGEYKGLPIKWEYMGE